jgi:hypothetical protein
MTLRIQLLTSFQPLEWNEEAYVKSPPFVTENTRGRVFLVPRDADVEATLDSISAPLGLKKRKQGHTSYLVSRANATKTLREFDWIARRSWHNRDISVLWALVYLGDRRRWTKSDVSLQTVADLAGLDQKECGEALARLFHVRVENGRVQGIGEFVTDRRLVETAFEKALVELPTWTEEMVMAVLCSSAGGSVAEIYESVLAQGLSVGAVYKVLEHLKAQGYVYAVRHFRVNERGPMREMLSADCRNCFFGFTNEDMCLQDTLRQLEGVLERDYHKVPTREERSAFYASMKAVPYSSRINKRVLASLRLMHEIDSMTREGRVSSLLKKIEEHYGVSLPMKTPVEEAP